MSARSLSSNKKARAREPGRQEVDGLMRAFSAGRYAQAQTLARTMTGQFPRYGLGWILLGAALQQLGRNLEALPAMQQAAALSPDIVETHYNLGIVLHELGRSAEAEAAYRRALQIRPDYSAAHYNLGLALYRLQRLEEAAACFRRALEINALDAKAYNNLGQTLHDLGRLDESLNCLRQALRIAPELAEAQHNLGATFCDLKRLDEAAACFRHAISIKPDYAEAHGMLGYVLYNLNRLDEAEACFRRALELRPDNVDELCKLGTTLFDLGRLNETEDCLKQALRLKPDSETAQNAWLYMLHFTPGHSPAEYLAEARRYGELVQVAAPFEHWSCERRPLRLRVGFVSGDLAQHPVGYFIEGLLKHLDYAALELFAYPTRHVSDALTERIKPCFSAWKPIAALSDAKAAEAIHADGLHILIDLAGHTAYHRLPVFAWKPAPVQMSWLGYFASTGIKQIDYFLADPWTVPAPDEGHFSERIWRLPETRLCMSAPAEHIDVAPLPALKNHALTFGCFNSLSKMNDAVLDVWSRILKSVPGSRLFLKAYQLQEARMRQTTVERFAAQGIAADRLILEGPSQREDYLAAYSRVDLALDPFPYTGGTTTAEALWMGVPVLTLAGDRLLSRQGVGLLMNAGLPEWVAATPEDYVARALAHAGDVERLAALRTRLRAQVLDSPVFDAVRFARRFEAALRAMWQAWEDQAGYKED